MFDRKRKVEVTPCTPVTSSLLERIRAASRAESQAAAEKLVVVADLHEERAKAFADREEWAVDVWEAVAAEVAAALRTNVGMGYSYLRYAMAMRLRLPKLGRAFEAGDIDYRLFQTAVFRTQLIEDPEALDTVDAQLAARAPRWPSMNRRKLSGAIDKIVAKVDKDAVRRSRDNADDRFVEFHSGSAGLGELSGHIFDTAGVALNKRLDQLAATVCDGDPRSRQQRRADAVEPLAVGADRLVCRCGGADCPAAGKAHPKGSVVIHVVAEKSALDGTSDEPAHVVGSDVLIPAEVLRELAENAARRPVIPPCDTPPEAGYRPSRALADFVRCRDLTCRAPGCEQPAIGCDIDHTVPYDKGGETHASNLKCLCRLHHLLKTFWGWQDEQLPDGTVIWTMPGGERYVTTPGSALLFPSLCTPTGSLPTPQARRSDSADRGVMMPRRARTRAKSRAQAIADERRHNRDRRLARSLWPTDYFDSPVIPETAAALDPDPPPF